MTSNITSSTTSSTMDFSGYLSDADLQLIRAGFTSELWTPEFGWETAEEEADMTPKPPQLLAALQLFNQLFVSGDVRVWAHLAAEMQAGKTGVITTFIRLVLANAAKLRFRPNRIFILTGMNDDAWKMQTRRRMPLQVRENVHHSKGLAKVALAFRRLMEKDNTDTLSNVIIVLDESHIAAGVRNQPYKQIWANLQELCPLEKWQEKNIRVITISATDPAKVMAISAENRLPAAVVRLQTTDMYLSVERLKNEGRIRYTEEHGDLHEPKAIEELKRCIREDFGGRPFYHILRPRINKQSEVERLIRNAFPECDIRTWDASSNSSRGRNNNTSVEENTSGCQLEDINELLAEPPAATTFIILKNMFYAAKTLNDTYVGVLYDRIGSKDDTNLQSLLGRACGYGKSTITRVYTSRQTVENYINCWREVCQYPGASRLRNIPVSRLDAKMTGVTASTVVRGSSSLLGVGRTVRTPLGAADDSLIGVAGGGSERARANEDNFDSVWKQCISFEEAKKLAPRSRTTMNAAGFYESSGAGKKQVLRLSDVLALKNGKKTANMDWKKLNIGDSGSRLYACYTDINNSATVQFWVHTITRKA